jgi:hypothetical protein
MEPKDKNMPRYYALIDGTNTDQINQIAPKLTWARAAQIE